MIKPSVKSFKRFNLKKTKDRNRQKHGKANLGE